MRISYVVDRIDDNVIQFACEVIENNVGAVQSGILIMHPSAVHLSRSFPEAVFEPLNLREKEWIFCPVNDSMPLRGGGTHWALLVISKKFERSFFLDSLTPTNFNVRRQTSTSLEAASQNNSSDCGVYTILYTAVICQFILRDDFTWIDSGLTSQSIDNMARNAREFIHTQLNCYFANRN
ncbi:unnamed protein product [Schistocephalus solidus]|uniref:ULP_PROTEASE domain-containing protein n=1 Tax=Schistocephalus solidus TaxID=70667 RepID=A0A183TTF3_SCHSO|nr:unnamed protein product [Schistocephalus solidus]